MSKEFIEDLEENDEDYKKFTERDSMHITHYISKIRSKIQKSKMEEESESKNSMRSLRVVNQKEKETKLSS